MAKPCVPSRETVIALLRRSGSVIDLTAGMPGGVGLGVIIDLCSDQRRRVFLEVHRAEDLQRETLKLVRFPSGAVRRSTSVLERRGTP